jgi:hypothetical protein
MKIYEQQGLKFNPAEKHNKKSGIEKSDFQSIMDGITSSTTGKESAASSNVQTPMVGGLDMIFNSASIYADGEAGAREQILTSLKDTLDLVDYYAKKLADTSLPSDRLSPLIEQLEQGMDSLKDLCAAAGDDGKLKSIITDITGTVGVEIEKFKRGDYA